MIAATHTTTGAANEAWDGLVIGAGPAGAAAALRLTRLGWRVLLVDRRTFPRPKVCGCCLSVAAIAELAALELPPGRLPAAVPLDVVRLAAGGCEARIAMPAGATVSREALDAGLVKAAIASGAAWLPELAVTAVDVQADGVAFVEARPAGGAPIRLRAGVVVIAAGLTDAIRITRRQATAPDRVGERGGQRARMWAPMRATSWAASGAPSRDTSWATSWAMERRIGVGATLPADAAGPPAGELVMAVGRQGYVGLVRLEDGRIDVAAAVAPAAVAAAASPAAVLSGILAEAFGAGRGPVQDGLLHAARVRGTPPLTHRSALAAGGCDTVIRIGDAAAYVEPFTGEGIGWALASARVFAAAAASTSSPAVRAARYQSGHGRLFGPRHARCMSVVRAVRHPRLLACAVRLGRVAPRVAAGVLPCLVGGGKLA